MHRRASYIVTADVGCRGKKWSGLVLYTLPYGKVMWGGGHKGLRGARYAQLSLFTRIQ